MGGDSTLQLLSRLRIKSPQQYGGTRVRNIWYYFGTVRIGGDVAAIFVYVDGFVSELLEPNIRRVSALL